MRGEDAVRRKQARHGHHVARRRNEGWRAPPHGRSSLQFLVELQAFLTLVGNTTLAFAAVRIALSNGWTFNDLNPLANGNPFDQSLKEEEPAAQSELPVLQVRRPASHAATRDACRRRALTRNLATARPHAPPHAAAPLLVPLPHHEGQRQLQRPPHGPWRQTQRRLPRRRRWRRPPRTRTQRRCVSPRIGRRARRWREPRRRSRRLQRRRRRRWLREWRGRKRRGGRQRRSKQGSMRRRRRRRDGKP